ncbi:HYR domain-containing protein [Corallococcus sicarius]|uniref:HYR domain-containing protein n=1 Tax=Corallococcus sicarius TaxID=2316726 RepID=A0A3A8NAR5_9BACT|nr:HYR domain-containing protein [Corallococcus sicarius]RKH38255.1 HYR domain-containing protein [Corallococcus sicarius]
MRTGSGRAWLSALALMAVSGPAVASGTSVGGPDSVSVRRLAALPDEELMSGLDANVETQPSVTLNGQLYFFTGRRVTDIEDRPLKLWATDGTAQGTRSVQDLLPTSAVIDHMTLSAVPGRMFFTAWSSGTTGRELWTSDGTAQGTRLVRDIQPGGANGLRLPTALVPFGDSVLFAAESSLHDSELWKSDGTEAGTVRLKDIAPGAQGSSPSILGRCGDAMLFSANGPEGRELWRTDGTEAGTRLVRDVRVGAESSDPAFAAVLGSTCFFTADDGQHGRTLWKTDGTQAGTRPVSDLVPGPTEPGLSRFTVLGDRLLFFVNDNGRLDLWKTDGTEAGTLPVKPVPGSYSLNEPAPTLVRAGARVYFMTWSLDSSGRLLWVTDGTSAGTRILPTVQAGAPLTLAAWGEELVFITLPNMWGSELWRTDGVTGNTYRLARLPSHRNFIPKKLLPFGDAMLVVSGDGFAGPALWRLDRDATAPAFLECPAHLDVAATNPQGTEMHLAPPALTGGQAPFTVRTSHPEGTPLSMPMSFGVRYQAEDAQGRVAACVIDVTVRDLTPPVLKGCPTQLTLNARSPKGAIAFYPAIQVTEETGNDIVITYSPEDGSLLPLGTTRMTMTVQDRAGHISTCSFPVTVRDGQPPTPACKVGEVRVEAEGPDGAHASWPELTSSDNISSQTTVTSSHASGDLFPIGITPVQLTSTDEAGNSRTCEIQVKVRDTRPPVLNCPADIALETAVLSGTRAEYPLATALDSVSPTQISYSPEPGSLLSPGEHSVRVTALDAAGNAALCSFQVSVEYDPTSDMQRGLGCSVGSGPASGASWAALLLLGWTLCRRRKGAPSDA